MNMHLVRTPGPYQRKRVAISIRLAELFYWHGDDYYFNGVLLTFKTWLFAF